MTKDTLTSLLKAVGFATSVGGILNDTQEEQNEWNAKMLKAIGLFHFPDDWDDLHENEKTVRLSKVLEVLNETNKGENDE